jgi:hypothetical protein
MKTTRIKLTGDYLSMYRFVFLPFAFLFLSVWGALMALVFVAGEGDLWPILVAILMAILLIVQAVRGKEVYFDKDQLYVTGWQSATYDLKKVRQLNGCYNELDRTFQIEFFPEKGSIRKINYYPSRREVRHFWWHKEFIGVSKLFDEKIKELGPSAK